MMRLCALLAVLVFMISCAGTRESGAAAVQARQATQGASKILTDPQLARELQEIPPEVREHVMTSIRNAVELMQSASDSLGPVIRRLGAIEPPAPVGTSADQAAQDPNGFARSAAQQAGRAAVEADQAEREGEYRATFSAAAASGGDLLSQLLLGTGVSGLVAGAALKILRSFKGAKAALEDAVAAGHDLAQATTPDAVEQVKAKHAARQEANGTRGAIKPILARVKAKSAVCI